MNALLLLLAAAPTTSALVLGQDAPGIDLQRTELRDGDRRIAAEVGYLTVPLFHEEPDGASIRLAVLRRRSGSSEPGPPIFFLNGIPGGASELATAELWDPYLEIGDVVFLDQRGSGRSEPGLRWDRPPYRAELLLSSRAPALENLRATAGAIRQFALGRGIDVGAFNTRESARDVDALRRALGYETIHLVGHSGGTHLGLEVVRSFGDRVARFVSLGTAGPNDMHSLPSQIDEFVRGVARLAAEDERIGDAMPDLFERLSTALDRIEREPIVFEVVHPSTGERVELRLGRFGLQFLLLMELGDPEDLALFPRMVHELEQGRVDVLRWYVERRYRQLSSLPALLFVNRAASGATAERWTRIRAEAEASPFGLARCFFSPELDEAFGVIDLGDGFRAPVESEVPTLFVSATLDGKTPPSRAEAARRGFATSGHLVLENGGHNDLLHHRELHDHVVAFLAGEAPPDRRIALPALRFALLEGDDPLVDHPALD